MELRCEERGIVREALSSKLAGIVLSDTAGTELRLGELWVNRPAVLVFLRHYG